MIRLIFIALLATFTLAKPIQELPQLSDKAKAIFEIENHKLEAQNGRIYNIYIAKLRESNLGNLHKDSQDSSDSRHKNSANSIKQDFHKIFYTLDGNAFFPRLLNIVAEDLSAFSALPFIVGIGHHSDLAFDRTLRTMDYLPKVEGDLAEQFRGSGGDEAFLAFILEQVKPFVKKRVGRIAQTEAIFGHSFGGIFVLNALFRAQNAFSYFIIASPSLWWGNGRDIAKNAQNMPEIYANVLFTRGSLENPKMARDSQDSRDLRKQKSDISLENLIAMLKSRAKNADLIDFIEFNGATHGESAPLAMIESLKRFSLLNSALRE